jgi:hypothetical protein
MNQLPKEKLENKYNVYFGSTLIWQFTQDRIEDIFYCLNPSTRHKYAESAKDLAAYDMIHVLIGGHSVQDKTTASKKYPYTQLSLIHTQKWLEA